MALTQFDYGLVCTIYDSDGNPYVNSWFFKAQAGFAGNSQDLYNAFGDSLSARIEAILHTSMDGVMHLSAFNLTLPADFFEDDYAGWSGGIRTGEYMPDYVGWAYRLNRPTRDVRNGRKTFGRISEGDVLDGVAYGGGATPVTTALAALATELSGVIEKASAPATNYKVCIPKSVLNVTTQKYELTTLYEASSVNYVRVSTQNSRKRF